MTMRNRPSPTLASLRRDLEEIDRAIVLLLGARVEAAAAAIRVRSEAGDAVTNLEQEARVLDRARAWAVEQGLSPRAVESVFRTVIDEGKRRFVLGPHLTPSNRRGRHAHLGPRTASHRGPARGRATAMA